MERGWFRLPYIVTLEAGMRLHGSRFMVIAGIVAGIAACSSDFGASPDDSTSAGGSGAPRVDTATVGGPSQPPPPPPDLVASFTLIGVVSGHQLGPDTTKVVAVADAAVTLVKFGEANGDTLKPSAVVATATTDAQGGFRMENLPPAYYRVDVKAPAGSPFGDGAWGVGPARQSEVRVYVALPRR